MAVNQERRQIGPMRRFLPFTIRTVPAYEKYPSFASIRRLLTNVYTVEQNKHAGRQADNIINWHISFSKLLVGKASTLVIITHSSPQLTSRREGWYLDRQLVESGQICSLRIRHLPRGWLQDSWGFCVYLVARTSRMLFSSST